MKSPGHIPCFWTFFKLKEDFIQMTKINLSKRLMTVANYIPKDTKVLADIGSDHAYLPCYVCLKHEHVNAIAGEVNGGPFESAQQQVNQIGLKGQIDVRLGDGLDILKEGEADTIVIAGMGGSLITSILDNGRSKLSNVKRLILQPNIDAQSVRSFAKNYNFKIVEEEILDEEGYIYEIVVLEPDNQSTQYTPKELYLGPILLLKKPDAFYRKWENVLHKKEKLLNK